MHLTFDFGPRPARKNSNVPHLKRREKCWKNQCIVLAIFQNFSFGPPLETMKKSCLNELKFWEASRNHKWSVCWNFQLSNSLGTQKASHVGIHIWESCSPFWNSVLVTILSKTLTNFSTQQVLSTSRISVQILWYYGDQKWHSENF